MVAVATVTTLIGWAVLFAHPAAASAAPRAGWATEAGRTARPAAGSSAYDWPELHRNPQLSGYAANGTVSTANAAGLGVRWATDLYGAILDSPVIAYDPASGQTLGYVGTDAGTSSPLTWPPGPSSGRSSSPARSRPRLWSVTAPSGWPPVQANDLQAERFDGRH